MAGKDTIDELVDRTLDQFGNAERLPADPHLYAHVLRRMEDRSMRNRVLSMSWKPALLSALVLANLYMLIWQPSNTASPAGHATRHAFIQVLAKDLNVSLGDSAFSDPGQE